jgi:hypothetical protein
MGPVMKISQRLQVSFFILVSLSVASLFAQTPTPSLSPIGSSLADLKQHPASWPAQLKLKADVRLVIMKNGAPVGAIIAPAESMVQLLGMDEKTLQIGVGSAQASVDPAQTDLWEQVAHAVSVTAAKNAPASAAPTPAAPPAVAASPPAAPTPTPVAPPPAAVTASAPQLFDYEAPPGDGYAKAAFHFWSPAYDQPLRGIIIMVPGTDGDGRGMVDDGGWQALARKYRLALVGCFFQGKNYMECSHGSGDALHDALKTFSTQSGRPEVATVPLLLWGISAGGEFNYNYILWKPENVMAFVVNKGGYYNDGSADGHSRSIPGLFFLGQSDADYRITAITRIWTEGRRMGALWALAPQPNSGHEFSKTDLVARTFFDAVLQHRLADDPAPPDGPPMKDMQENQGWIGNLTTHEIHDGSTDSDPDLHAAWLPDESTANAWKVFVSGG